MIDKKQKLVNCLSPHYKEMILILNLGKLTQEPIITINYDFYHGNISK